MTTKICSVCKIEKPIQEFGPRFRIPHKRANCRLCDAVYQRSYRKNNLEKSRAIGRASAKRAYDIPEKREIIKANRRRLWHQGKYKQRTQDYLDRLKRDDFFRWKARKSYVHLTAEQLKQLWESQMGLCALTGRSLGSNPQLDHIVPKTRGGDDSCVNLRWLCAEANQAKRNLLDDEFIQLCREVVTFADQLIQNS